MGLAASQARALLLVARKSDLEYRAQCLTQRKMVLSQQTEQIAKDYSRKISNRKLRFVYNMDASSSDTKTEDLTYYSLGASNPKFVGEYRVLNAQGAIVVASKSDIPQYVEEYIPTYYIAKVATDAAGKQTVTDVLTDETPVYTETNKKTGADGTTGMYIYACDETGKLGYIQVQDNQGKPIGDATYYTKGEDGTPIPHKFYMATTADDEDKTVSYTVATDSASLKLYTKAPSRTYKVVTDTSEKLPDGYKYISSGKKEVLRTPRQPGADGYYTSDDGRRYIIVEQIANTTYFQNGLRNGSFVLQKANPVDKTGDDGQPTGETVTTWDTLPWQGIDAIQDVLYTEDDALAESEYEAKTAAISAQDKMLDCEIKQIETQHKAIEAEMDSVKKIIEGNIDKTFKIFAA